VLWAVFSMACAGAREPTPERAPPPGPTEVVTKTPVVAPPPGTPTEALPNVPSVELLAFERVLDVPVHSVALGKGTRFAAIGQDVWLDDGKGKKKLPSPASQTDGIRIYFGRDDQPRLMGFNGSDSVYLRWRGGAWQKGATEIGKLGAGTRAPLFGVLGYDDPEVVCKVGEQCIIKRLTGWTTIDAPKGRPDVVLASKSAWAFEGSSLLRLDKDKEGFRPVAEKVSFTKASGVWASGPGDIWVTEAESSSLHHFDGKEWKRDVSPVAGPRGLWATNASDIWLTGDGGAAHFDGKTWSRVKGASDPVAEVTGRSADEVWLAGKSGVWRGTKR
jgi:hypothetical protein